MKKKFFPLFMLAFLVMGVGCAFLSQNYNAVTFAEEKSFSEQVMQLPNYEAEFVYIKKDSAAVKTMSAHTTAGEEVVFNEEDYKLVSETNGVYKYFNKYSFQRLMVYSDYENDYGAIGVAQDNDGLTVLAYESKEATKQAYFNLRADGVVVVTDDLVMADGAEEQYQPIQHSGSGAAANEWLRNHEYSWADEALQTEAYAEYISQYNCDKEVIIVVIDTGICTGHIGFQGRLAKGADGDLLGIALDDTKWSAISQTHHSDYAYTNPNFEGKEDQLAGYKYYQFEDDYGHGTMVAGCITAITPANVKIATIKTLSHTGSGATSNTLASLDKALAWKKAGYNIIGVNMSLGGTYDLNNAEEKNSYDRNYASYEKKIKALRDLGVFTTVAAGNQYIDSINHLPAAAPAALTITSVQQTSTPGEYRYYEYDSDGDGVNDRGANYGESVDFCAPGAKIFTWSISREIYTDVDGERKARATPQNETFTLAEVVSGTSFASPYACAVVTLLCLDNHYYTNSKTPPYNLDQIEGRLKIMAKDLGDAGKDIYHGYGLLDMTNFSIELKYSQEDSLATYDGQAHPLKFTSLDNCAYPIKYSAVYGETEGVYTLTERQLKNFTNGRKKYYYKVSASVDFGDGYIDGVFLDSEGSGYIQIDKRDISGTVQNQSCVYGEVNLNKFKFSLNKNQLISGDESYFSLATTADNTSEVGEYPINLTCSSDNYNIVSTQAGTLTITPRVISVKADNKTLMYGENPSYDDVVVMFVDSPINGDQLSFTLSTDATSTSGVGKYPYKVTCSNKNYTATVTTGALTITPRNVTISITDQEGQYGDAPNLSNVSYTVTEGSVVNNDDLQLIAKTNATTKSAVGGEYYLKVSSGNKNYSVTCADVKYIIVPREVTIQLKDKTLPYSLSYSVSGTGYDEVVGNVVNGDSLSLSYKTVAVSKSGVGYYEITANSANANYDVTILPGTLTVIPREIQVSVTKQQGVYGGNFTLGQLPYTITSGQVLTGDVLTLTFATYAANRSDAGDYDIYVAGQNNINYDVSVSQGTFEVIARTIKIALGNKTSVYGEMVSVSDVGYSIKSGMVLEGDNLDLRMETDASRRSDVGSYSITAQSGNQNYKVTCEEGTYEIVKRSITIKLVDQVVPYAFTYDFSKTSYDVVSGNLVKGDDLKLIFFTNAGIFSLGGECSVWAESANQNYDVIVLDASAEITFSFMHVVLIIIGVALLSLVIVPILVITRKRNKEFNEL
ncbi:MAG: S8 family serine peptidase [Clostridia bacterium]|nr:S8 family serine peptidase [Clostridia bacterium]